MDIELELPENINFLYTHDVEFMTIEVPEERRNGKPYYIWNDEFVSAEVLATKLFQSNGFSVISGLEIRNAYNYIAFTRDYIIDEFIDRLSKHKQFGKLEFGNKIQELKNLRKKNYCVKR